MDSCSDTKLEVKSRLGFDNGEKRDQKKIDESGV